MANLGGVKPDSVFVSAPDGLKLHVVSYGSATSPHLPVVCLPGLTRTAADFETLAEALATDRSHPRRVLALDYRGRGRSEYDRHADNYSLAVELGDLMAVLTALGAEPAVFIGSSRGGLLAMLLAAVRPAAIAGVVLNDIGPVIEIKGLMRIKSYVGRLPQPKSFTEGAEILRRLFDVQFPTLDGGGWLAAAHKTWNERDGRLTLTYDVKLADTLKGIEPERPAPPLWKEFDALKNVPLMVIRGANSDLLSAETVQVMRARRAAMESIVVPDQGHTPLLVEPDIIEPIAAFIASCDTARPH